MNRTHRSLWNSALGAWVAVSENTHARGKKSHKTVALAVGASMLMAAGSSFAGGDGGGGGFLIDGAYGTGRTLGNSTTGAGGNGGAGDLSPTGVAGGALGANGTNGASAVAGVSLDGTGGGGGGSARTGTLPVTSTIKAGSGGKGGTGAYAKSEPGGAGGGGGGGAVLATQSFEVRAGGALIGGNGGNGGSVVANTSSLTGAGGGGGAGVLVVPVGGVTITNAGIITGGNGGTGLAAKGIHPITGATIYGGAGGNGEGGALGGTQLGASAQGGAGIVGSNLTIVNSGTISGGLSGDGTARASAIQLGGNGNTLTLQAGSKLVGSVIAAGTGNTLNLQGTNTEDDAFQGFSTVNAASGSKWTLSGKFQPTGNLAVNVAAGTGGAASAQLAMNGVVSGTGGLTAAGGGTLSLGAANTYSGGTAIDSGTTVQVGNASALGTGAVTLNGGKLAATATFDLANALSFGTGQASTVAAANGKTLGLNGSLTLGANATAVFGSVSETGIVRLNAGTTTIDTTAAAVVAGGTLQVGSATRANTLFTNAASTTVNSGATLDLNSQNVTIGNLQGAGTLRTGGVTNSGATVRSGEFSGAVTGSGQLVKTGAGTLILTGTNTYAGGTTISAGTLQIGNGGTTGSIAGDVTDNAALVFNRSNAIGFAGDISGSGSVSQSGTGTLTLSGNNTYSGGTRVNSGILQAGQTNDLGTGALTMAGGKFVATSTFTFSRGVNFDAGQASTIAAVNSRTLTLGGTVTLGTGSTATFGSKTETGTVVLSGANGKADGTAAVVVAGGTVRVGNAGTANGIFGNAASTTVNSGATLDLDDTSTRIHNLQGAGKLDTGASAKAAQLTTVEGGAFSGVVLGTGKLVKTTADTLTLTGTNTYTGGTTISGGTLQVGNGGTAGSIVGDVLDNGTLQFNRSDNIAFGSNISGSGSLTKSGAGKLTLTGTNTFAGGTTIEAGTLQVGNGGKAGSIAGNVANNGALVFNRSDAVVFAGDIGGTGTLANDGTARLTLTGTNTFTGATFIGAKASLQVGNGGTRGTLTGDVVANGNLIFDRSDASSYGGTVSGAGSLTKNGAGELEITAASTYTGGTQVNAGTLRVNNTSGSATGTGNVQVGSGATLAGGGTISGAVTVADGGRLAPGNNPGTLTTGNLTLGNGAFLDYQLGGLGESALNDLVKVNGNLVLGGTLNVTESAGGSFGPGLYRLIKYTGTLTDNGLKLGTAPVAASDLYVQSTVANEVNLINSKGVTLNFWDGSDPAKYNDGTAGGGSGTWRVGTPGDGWADADGKLNATWKQNGFAMFGGTAGTVTVDNTGGNVTIGGAQFFTDGYLVNGGALTLGEANTIVKVGDGTASGASMKATIASALTGAGGLTKDDYGTLVLTGANNYSGGTHVKAGVLQGNTTSLQGDIVNDARVTFDQSADGSYAGAMSGTGSLRKTGAGELKLTAASSYGGGTQIDAGTIDAAVGGALGTGPVAVNGGAGLSFSGSADAGSLRIATAARDGIVNGGYVQFKDSSSAGSATLVTAAGANVTFADSSTAGGAVIENRGGGTTVWNDASAGKARITNFAGGHTDFLDNGSAGQATLVNQSGGLVDFFDNATANKATVVNNAGGTVRISKLGATGINIGSLQGAGRVLLGAKTLTTGGLNTDTEISGVISGEGGSVVKEGTGALTLSGANTYTGGTALKKGRLNIANAQALGTGELAMDDGTTLGFSVAGLVLTNAIRFTGNSDPVIDTGAMDVGLSGAISGAGFITKQGSGTLTLSGANSYTGATDVAQGTLKAGAANSFSAASAHSVAAGATIDLAGFSQTVASLANSGTVSLVGTVPGTTLTVNGNYVGNNGVLKLGTALYFNGPPSDRLVINGGVASGKTTVQVTNIGGLGALTNGNGIEVITAQNGATTTAQTTKDAFALAGGHVDAGAFEYRLYAADAQGQGENWYLRSAEKGVTYYRPEAALYAALPSQLRQGNLAMLGDVRKRVGDDDVKGTASTPTGSERRAWARVLSTDIDIRQGGAVSPTSKGRLTGFQAGTDLLAAPHWRAGIYVGQLDGDVRVRGYASGVQNLNVGRNDLRSQYVGIYGTYTNDNDFYADAVVQSGRHRYTVEPLLGAGVGGKGNSLLGSIEVGQAFPLGGSGWTIEPQLQLIHQHMDLNNSAIVGAIAQPQADSGWIARAGVRVKGEIDTGMGTLQPYGRINVYKTSSGADIARFVNGTTTTDIAAPTGSTSTELAGGFTLALSPSTSLYGEIGKLWSSGGDAKVRSSVNGSVGVRVKW